jgi:hypothetical protein
MVAMITSIKNLFRQRMVNAAREYKALCFGDNGKLKRSAEHVLADLRAFCKASDPTIFSTDALLMARREGRREVFVRIQRMLNLDESEVQKLMEIDDE